MQRTLLCGLILFTLILTKPGVSQDTPKKQVKLIHADAILFDKSIVDAQRLIGNVELLHEGTTFLCDSAHLYASQDFDAFGSIRVNHPGGYSLTGGKMFFTKKNQQVRFKEKVVMNDGDMTLTSDQLVYDLKAETGRYTTGGKIVSTKNKNVLTSRKGTYSATEKAFFFRDNVVLTNPDYTVRCDTLQYREATETAFFFGPTTITSDDTRIYCENGWYDTRHDISQFNEHARITSDKTVLTGDSIYYNGKLGFGEVFRNVTIRDTTSNILITGQYGKHTEQSKTSLVTREALLIQAAEGDSLFMSADTLLAVPDSADKQFIRAFHGVKIFRADLQGLADSLTYSETDSLLVLYSSPVLWNEANQVTGDTIGIRTWKGHIDRMLVNGNAFIISEAIKYDSTYTGQRRYNQIKGRDLTGLFRENAIYRVKVEGNGQLIYFPAEEEEEGVSRLIGHNTGECSDLDIHLRDNQIKRINLIREPDSVFTPIQMNTDTPLELEGFKWRGLQRPTRSDLPEIP
jgi:lipopolysaccharide export system protein LptA